MHIDDMQQSKTSNAEMDDPFVLQERLGWAIMDQYFGQPGPTPIFRYQIDSFNEYIAHYIPLIFAQYNPVVVYHDFREPLNRYATEVRVTFTNVTFAPSMLFENNGVKKPMTPMAARLRNLTYAGNMFVDLNIEVILRTGEALETEEIQQKMIAHVNIGSFPVMVMSDMCLLHHACDQRTPDQFDESVVEAGAYFIIKGGEKVVVAQERQAENKICCFCPTKGAATYSHYVEVKSSCQRQFLPSKPLTVKITTKTNLVGNLIRAVVANNFRTDIPVVILFRALGVVSDRQVTEFVFHDLSSANELFHLLRASFDEATEYRTQEAALRHLAGQIVVMGQLCPN
jgi:DNA-directed RNA polymerase II subunit RPB2